MEMVDILKTMLANEKLHCSANDQEIKRLYDCIADLKLDTTQSDARIDALEQAIKKLGGDLGKAQASL